MRQILLAVLIASCAGDESHRVPAPRTEPTPPPRPAVAAAPTLAARVDPRTATRQAAHDALAEHCGECHEGHRSTNARALAVFDLDRPDWPGRFDDHRFETALRRLAGKPEPARAAFLAFRDAERAAAN